MNVASLKPDSNELLTSSGPAVAAAPIPSRPAADAVYPGMQTLAIALVLILVGAILHIGESAYIAFAFTGAFVTHLMFRPERRELLSAIGAGAGFGAVYLLHHGAIGNFYGSWFAIPGAFLGMGTLFTLGARWIWTLPDTLSKDGTATRRGEKWMRFERVRDAALVPLLCVTTMVAVGPAIGLTPMTYDRLLYLVDSKFALTSLGIPPSWAIGRLFLDHNWMRTACGYVYNSLPLGVAICLAFQWQDRQRKIWYPLDLRWLSMTLGGVGFLLYQICPAAGPIYLFPKQFPLMVPNLAWIAAAPGLLGDVPRNGMPSLHVASTMLLFWNMRHRAWWISILAGIYVGMTALATLGLGEHYLVDLMVALPIGLVMQALWLRTRGPLRWAAIGVGAALTLGWLIAFRTGAALAIPAGPAMWVIGTMTVVVPVAMAWWLEQGIRQAPPPTL
jgi:hypothetical protein